MKRWKKTLIELGKAAAGLLALQYILILIFSRHDLVSSLFSAGSHIPFRTMFGAMLFLVTRIFTGFILPGLILAGLGRALYEAYFENKQQL